MDDLTQLVRAQRQAAWSEVAQRIAHEIKNPLTPIQLAAERIQRQAGNFDPEISEMVFGVRGHRRPGDRPQGAGRRVPPVRTNAGGRPRPASVSRIVREVGSLYEGVREGLTVDGAPREGNSAMSTRFC